VWYWANPVAWQRQSQLHLQTIAAMIASCKHPVRGLTKTKPQVASVLCLSSKTLSCVYTSRTNRTCVIILCVSNLRRVFSKCSFRWHSAYFHSALYPSFCRKIRIEFSASYPLTTFRIPRSAKYPFRTSTDSGTCKTKLAKYFPEFTVENLIQTPSHVHSNYLYMFLLHNLCYKFLVASQYCICRCGQLLPTD